MKSRLFIAVDFSPLVKKQLINLINTLKQDCPGVKWVGENNLHLTLKFLGHTTVDPQKIADILKTYLNQIKPFEINFGKLEAFVKHNVIIYFEIEPSQPLKFLLSIVDKCCGQLGFAKETRSYLPHVTLGRIKKPDKLAISKLVRQTPDIKPMLVDKVIIFQSTLGQPCAKHTALIKLSLGKP